MGIRRPGRHRRHRAVERAGRYGWAGGTGTSAHIVPSTGTIAILLTQVAADSTVPPQWMRDFWRYAAS